MAEPPVEPVAIRGPDKLDQLDQLDKLGTFEQRVAGQVAVKVMECHPEEPSGSGGACSSLCIFPSPS